MQQSKKTLYLRATSLMGIDRLCEEHGLDAAEELKAVNIDPAALANFTKLIAFDAFNNLMLQLARKTGIQTIGFELAQLAPHNLNNMGPLAIVLKLGETTGQCAENAIRYIKYLTNGLDVRIVRHENEGLGEFRYTPYPPMANTRHLAEHALATVRSAMILLLMDESIVPRRVTFRHSAPDDITSLERHFGCSIDFECESNSIFFDIGLLDIETMGTDEQIANIVYSYLEAEIEKLSQDLTMEELVEMAVLQLLPSGHCGIDLVSKAVGVHPKNLQRQLRAEGTNFSTILERKRMETAVQLLTETRIPANRIGQSCGYSSATAFNLAFKKWSGQTPNAYRAAQQKMHTQNPA